MTDNYSVNNHIQGTWFEYIYPQFNSNSNFQVYDWLARWSQDLVSCNCTGFRNYESDLDARYHPFETLAFFRGSIIGQIFRWLMSVSLRFEPHIKFNCDLWLYYDFFGQILTQYCTFLMPIPLKRRMLGASTIILSKVIHN